MTNPRREFPIVQKIVNAVFAEELHHQQVLSILLVVFGVVCADRLGVAAIGTAAAKARGTSPKHGIKQVDRFMSNEKLRLADLRPMLVRFVVGGRASVIVTMDWTDFDRDDQTTLCISLVLRGKRALPLVWTTVRKSQLKGRRALHERTALQELRRALPPECRAIVLADRGFGDVETYDHLLGIAGFDFVIRFRADIIVAADGQRVKARELVPRNGRVRVLESARLTAEGSGPYTVVLYKARGMKDSWCLATSLPTVDGRDIVDRYARRFECEEGFRDLKDRRYGIGLKHARIGDPTRRDRLLIAVAIAMFVFCLAGEASERVGYDRQLRANTEKSRTHSLLRQGREALGGIPPEPLRVPFAVTLTLLVETVLAQGFAHVLD